MELYEHKFNNGFDEHFRLGLEDESDDNSSPVEESGLVVILTPRWEKIDGEYHPCADIICRYNGEEIDINDTDYQYYFDDIPVIRFNDVSNLTSGIHTFTVVVNYKNNTKISSKTLIYENTD